MKTILFPCSALKQFVDYWDEWHLEWYKRVTSTPPVISPIKGWDMPDIAISKYFPEPYWGNPYTDRLVAVFININPGGGGDCQDILGSKKYDPISEYLIQKNVYSRTVEELSKNNCYITTKWFHDKRVKWLEKLYECKKETMPEISVQNIICADLIPWHTQNVNGFVKKYIKLHSKLIIDNVITPITNISQCAEIKGIVFAKGAEIEHLLDVLVTSKSSIIYRKGDYRIRIFDYNNAKIIVFVGGQGMSMPNPCDTYTPDGGGSPLTVAEIVKKYMK